jgi:hypothetical protein
MQIKLIISKLNNMKKIILVICICSISFSIKAQNATTNYDTCQFTAQFAGQWMYTNILDTIRITLRHKRDYSQDFNHLADNMHGWIEYKRGNTIIESTYQFRYMELPFLADTRISDHTSILCRLYTCSANNRTLEGSIIDYSQLQEIHNIKATINATNTQMIWKQSFAEWNGAISGAHGMTLPREFTLTRQ